MTAEIYLYGSVGASFWGEEAFSPADVRALLAEATGPLRVRLNSGGGIATDGAAIYSMLRSYPETVTVIVEGVAASAASLIAMAGDRIEMSDGATMMIHDPAQWIVDGRGTEDDHLRAAAGLRVTADAYARIYAARAGITAEEARAIMKAETWFDGPAAVAAGFADVHVEETEGRAAARFDYGIYAHAPNSLRNAGVPDARRNSRASVMAMMAGVDAQKPKETTMKKDDTLAGDGEDTIAATAAEDTMPGGETDDTLAAAEGDDTLAAEHGDEDETDDEDDAAVAILTVAEALGRPMAEARDAIAAGLSVTRATAKFHEARQKESPMTGKTTAASAARVTVDGRDKFKQGAELALMARAGLPGGQRNEFSGMTMSELAREALSFSDPRAARSANRLDMVGRAFTMSGGSHTTSDFANVLANVMGKAALQGWEEAAETFEAWTTKGTLSDFKATKRVGLGTFASLPAIPENGEYNYGTVGDRGENIVLATYGKLLRITRQAIINDDLSLLGSVPRKMGRAARRTVGDLVYAVLTSNPTMSDGVALFHANHGNLAASGAALSVASLGAARSAMRKQKDGDAVLNIAPAYLIVPSSLETLATQLMTSIVDPTDNKGHATNPVAGMAEVVVDARLDAASATAWYLSASPTIHDTVEVAYLDGNDAPYLEEQTGWNVDGVEMKVRIDAGVAPTDSKGLYKNPGA